MNLSDVELPSNKKFGFFFSAIFISAGIYFYIIESSSLAFGFAAVGCLFLLTAFVKADLLLPLNKIWMRFGLLLGMIVSPIVLGVIFFAMFTPISLLMRLFGRDELRLRLTKKTSHWISREAHQISESFKYQF